MKYFIIRDKSDNSTRLAIYDCLGNNVFSVSGELTGKGQTLTVSSTEGKVLLSIAFSQFAFPNFHVRIGKKHIIFIMTPNGKSPMMIYGVDASFEGVLLTGEYTLKGSQDKVVAFQKHSWCSKGECHELEVIDERYTPLALAVTAAISIYYGIYDADTATTAG